MASPVGDGSRFVVVGIMDSTASVVRAKAALVALCSALEVPLRAVTAALGGDLDGARRTIAEATAAATAPPASPAALDRSQTDAEAATTSTGGLPAPEDADQDHSGGQAFEAARDEEAGGAEEVEQVDEAES